MDVENVKEFFRNNKFALPALVGGAGLGVITLITNRNKTEDTTPVNIDPNTADTGDQTSQPAPEDNTSLIQQIMDQVAQLIGTNNQSLTDQFNQAISDLADQTQSALETLAGQFSGGASGGYAYAPEYGYSEVPGYNEMGDTTGGYEAAFNPAGTPSDYDAALAAKRAIVPMRSQKEPEYLASRYGTNGAVRSRSTQSASVRTPTLTSNKKISIKAPTKSRGRSTSSNKPSSSNSSRTAPTKPTTVTGPKPSTSTTSKPSGTNTGRTAPSKPTTVTGPKPSTSTTSKPKSSTGVRTAGGTKTAY